MTTLGIIILGFVLFIFLLLILTIYLYFLRFKNFLKKRKLAKLYYYNVKKSCTLIPIIREEYFQTHFMQDEEKIKKQKDLEEMYNTCIKELEDAEREEYIFNYLPDKDRENLKKLLQAPRYELH